MKRHLSTSEQQFHGPLGSQMCRCQAVPRKHGYTHVHTHFMAAQRGLCDEQGQRQGRLLHGTLDMIRSAPVTIAGWHYGRGAEHTEHFLYCDT